MGGGGSEVHAEDPFEKLSAEAAPVQPKTTSAVPRLHLTIGRLFIFRVQTTLHLTYRKPVTRNKWAAQEVRSVSETILWMPHNGIQWWRIGPNPAT